MRARGPSAGGIRSFKEAQLRERAFEPRDRGLQAVPLKRIVGSVSRYRDFDARFRLKRHLPRERLAFIRGRMGAGRPLPPVELYQIKGEYFVMDGHHRIAVARERGFRTIEARVIELLPSPLHRERLAFQAQAALPREIELTEEGQYAVLLDQIRGHQGFLAEEGRAASLAEAAADWHRTIYEPLTAILESSSLLRRFPGRTVADLYAYISVHQWTWGHPASYGRRIDRILRGNMEEFRANRLSR